METPKFKLDRPDLSEEAMLRHKDFNKVLEQHGAVAKPGFKPWQFWSGATAIIVIAIVSAVVLSNGPEIVENPIPEVIAAVDTDFEIASPIAGIEIPFQEFTINADSGAQLQLPSGTVIDILPQSLVNEEGLPLSGEVQLRYREFHDPADFFLSGIPMIYDSAGIQYHFESAGMFEMRGSQDETAAYISKEKPITVRLASFQPGNHYNIYQLNERDGQWAFVAKDKAGTPVGSPTPPAGGKIATEIDQRVSQDGVDKVEKMLAQEAKALETEIEKMAAAMPAAPRKVDPNGVNLKIDVDPNEFPEVAAYGDFLFEIGPENTNYDPSLAQVNWDDVTIGREENHYLLTFVKGSTSYTFSARPVMSGSSYEAALAAFDAKNASALDALEKKKKEAHQKQEELNYLHAKYLNESANANNRHSNELQWLNDNNAAQNMVERTFTIHEFGIWNSDCPHKLPKGEQLIATFNDKGGAETDLLELPKVYLVERGKNALYTIFPDRYGEFSWNPENESMIWAMHQGNLMIYTYDDFAALNSTETQPDSMSFRLARIPGKITNAGQVKQLMGI